MIKESDSLELEAFVLSGGGEGREAPANLFQDPLPLLRRTSPSTV